jgi:hypothetical protein
MTIVRYVGIDVHKRHVVVAAVDVRQEIVITPMKLSVHELVSWAQDYLKPTDQVALEATTNAWEVHDQLVSLVDTVSVANSARFS